MQLLLQTIFFLASIAALIETIMTFYEYPWAIPLLPIAVLLGFLIALISIKG